MKTNPSPDTTTSQEREWEVIFQTRLGILCGSNPPSVEQIAIATEEADEHIKKLQCS